jgi:hypothetical protein
MDVPAGDAPYEEWMAFWRHRQPADAYIQSYLANSAQNRMLTAAARSLPAYREDCKDRGYDSVRMSTESR